MSMGANFHPPVLRQNHSPVTGRHCATLYRSTMPVSLSSEAPKLPADQVDALIDAVEGALDRAHQGRAAEGYAVLREGCQHGYLQ